MAKPTLGYARVFLNDLVGECEAHGLGLREQGILLRLLRAQHIAGSIPADLTTLRRLVGSDATPAEVKAVADLFFPRDEKDPTLRTNQQHAAEREKAIQAYGAAVRKGGLGGQRTKQKWAEEGSANSSANSSG